jgi:diguanylate cyclase (GGDEF)-like protein
MVADVIQKMVRSTDLAARFGGEEFVVVTPQITPDGLRKVAERIRRGIEEQSVVTENGTVSVTVSIGGAHSEVYEDVLPAEKLVELADRCLYSAKQAGRNRCHFGGQEAGDWTGGELDPEDLPAVN